MIASSSHNFFIVDAEPYILERGWVTMKLSQEMMKILEGEHFLTYLCTSSKDGKPSARLVGVLPSEDMSEIYVGSGRLNKAERDLNQNKKAMMVFYSLSKLKATGYKVENYFEIKGFQVECQLQRTIKNKEDPIFRSIYDVTKEAVNEDEAKLIKSVHIFKIEQIYDCSAEGEGKPITSKDPS